MGHISCKGRLSKFQALNTVIGGNYDETYSKCGTNIGICADTVFVISPNVQLVEDIRDFCASTKHETVGSVILTLQTL